jgi:flagellar assembly protein FliH
MSLSSRSIGGGSVLNGNDNGSNDGRKRSPRLRAAGGTAVLKGPGVHARYLVVSSALALPVQSRAAGNGPPRPPASAEARLAQATQALEAARAEARRLVEAAQAEAQRILAAAEAEAAQERAQAQVELGRAQAEAEALRAAAEARLAEAEEIITTAAQARRLLAESQEQAAQTVAAAEAEAAAIRERARREGHEAGRQAGYDEGARAARQELAQQLELAHEIAAQAVVDRRQLIASAEQEIIRLAMHVARKIVAKEIEQDPDVLRGLLTRAMLKVAGTERMRLRLHPQTIEVLGEYLSNITARFAERGVEVVADPAVDPAGVIIDTRAGTVDARVETQLQKIERTLLTLTGEAGG